jgi:hypothetical protein
MRFHILTASLGLCLALAMPSPAESMYAISGDINGIPRLVSTFTPAGPATSLFTLGDGSLGFTGGLAYNTAAAVFYTIGSDGFGESSLYSFDLTGALAFQFSLGQGFFGGLAWNSGNGNLYAARNDFEGNSSIYELDLGGQTSTYLFSMRQGLTGGLTYNTADGDLYGIVNDPLGNSTLMQIPIATGAFAATAPPLGTGFLGGVAFDAATGGYFAINMDPFGASTLNAIVTGGSGSVTPGPTLGYGYAAAGLTYGPEAPDATVPEPATWLLCITGMVLAAWSRRRMLG